MSRQTKRILAVAGAVVILCVTAVGGSAAQPVGVDVEYVVHIGNPGSGKAEISMKISGIEDDYLEVEEYCFQGCYVNVLSLSVRDLDGNLLPVEHDVYSKWAGREDADYWRVHCGAQSSIIVTYTVQPGSVTDGVHYGYVAAEFAAFQAGYVLLVPKGTNMHSARIAFELPAGWGVFTPWAQGDGFYYPDVSQAQLIPILLYSSCSIGPFDVHSKTIGATEVSVVTYAGWPTSVKESLANSSWSAFAFQTSVFGASAVERYMFHFLPRAPNRSFVYVGEWSNGQGDSVSVEGDRVAQVRWKMFGHQLVHVWNHFDTGPWGGKPWWAEGPADFYGGKTAARLGFGQDMEGPLREMYRTYLEQYVAMGADRAVASVEGGDPDAVFFIYRKGEMVCFLLAKEIFLGTDGAKTMDDLMQLMFQKYGQYRGTCDEPCIQSEVEDLTGLNFTQFFTNYVYGRTALPMQWAFEDDDGDELSNALEIAWDTHPRRADTDGDGYTDAREVAAGSNPLDPLSIPHTLYLPALLVNASPPGLPISIDGAGADWQNYPPVASDASGDSVGGAHTDVKALHLEWCSSYLYLMFEVYDPPLVAPATLELNLELVDGSVVRRLGSNIQSAGGFFGWMDTDGDGELEPYPVRGALMAWGDVFELRLPLRALGQPQSVRFAGANLWCDVNGAWTGVDMIHP